MRKRGERAWKKTSGSCMKNIIRTHYETRVTFYAGFTVSTQSLLLNVASSN